MQNTTEPIQAQIQKLAAFSERARTPLGLGHILAAAEHEAEQLRRLRGEDATSDANLRIIDARFRAVAFQEGGAE